MQRVSCELFEPHQIFTHYYHNHPEAFENKFLGTGGGPDRLEEFWDEVERRDDPRIRSHPMRRRADWKRRAIPIEIHGDEVPVIRVGKHNTASLDNVSIKGVLANGPTMAVKLWIFGMMSGLYCK